MEEFYQDPPELGNQYRDDPFLKQYLKRTLPQEILDVMEPVFDRMGKMAASDLLALSRQAEAEPPRHLPYDAWGRRIDRIETSPAWDRLKRISAEEGLVAMGYERNHGVHSRLCQFTLLYLFHPSSAVFTCPLAMTDGAARAIELYGDNALKTRVLPRLCARDPARFWTSGQWMTERSGGSDVGGTSTVAKPQPDGSFQLFGTKWFTSATTSEMAMTLARIEGAPEGSHGLSLFFLELRDERQRLDNILIHRLKDKLGTRALPTAELTLAGTRAWLVGGPGEGIKKIASLFNITRIYNAVCALAYLRRGLVLAQSYARQRHAFGQPIAQLPLHRQTLAEMEVSFRANFLLVFELTRMLGKDECGIGGDENGALLRLLTPLAKLFTAKQSVAACSETLECFGGAGYVEDTHLPVLLRDAQVLSIWEGTTNILSLDCLRALAKTEALHAFQRDVKRRLETVTTPELGNLTERVEADLDGLVRYCRKLSQEPRQRVESGARILAFNLARTYCAALLLEQARIDGTSSSFRAAHWWIGQGLLPFLALEDSMEPEASKTK